MITDKNVEAALVAGAHKELAYLEQFGQPLLPFRRERREAYQYKEQLPSAHIENLNRYLLMASSLVPRIPALEQFSIRHPDVQPGNIIVSRSADSDWQIIGLIDWQHTLILPLFVIAGVPHRLENFDDPVSQSMTHPSLPENFDELDKAERVGAEEVYLRRLAHYHYITNMEEYNYLHYVATMGYMCMLRRRLFYHASEPWEGETLELKVALIRATERWEVLTGGDVPCPVVFDDDDIQETMRLRGTQEEMKVAMGKCQDIIGVGMGGWIQNHYYEEVVARNKQLKEHMLTVADSAEARDEIMYHWPFDDMDEEKYM